MTYSIMLYGKMLGLNKESMPLKWQTLIFPFNMKFATKRDDISNATVFIVGYRLGNQNNYWLFL